MQPTDLVWAFGYSAHLGDIQRRGIGENERFGLENIVKCWKEAQFLLHVLDHCLDNKITIGKVCQVESAVQTSSILIYLPLCDLVLARHHIPCTDNAGHPL